MVGILSTWEQALELQEWPHRPSSSIPSSTACSLAFFRPLSVDRIFCLRTSLRTYRLLGCEDSPSSAGYIVWNDRFEEFRPGFFFVSTDRFPSHCSLVYSASFGNAWYA